MNTEARPQRLLWIIGILLLAGTVFGAGRFFNLTSGGNAQQVDMGAPPPVIVSIGKVDMEAGVTQLYPVQQGRVVEVIKEGVEVKKGDVLLKLDSRLADYKLAEAKADLDNAQKQLELARLLPEQHKLKKDQQKDAVTAAKHQRESTQHELNIKTEQAKLTGSALNESIKRAYEEQVKKLDAVVSAEEAKLRELELFDAQPKIAIARAQAEVNAKKAQVEQAELAVNETQLKAPSDGLVLRVLVSVGEVLGANPRFAAIQFAPKGQKIVRAEVLQEWASRVKVGQEVLIEDDTYAGKTWTGKVTRISDWFSEKRDKILEPFYMNDVRTMECIVELTSAEHRDLRIYQRVRVKIKQS